MTDSMQQALRALPHGPEFRFLDQLLELDPGKRATGEYTVRGDEPFLAGHFPEQPLFPGVLLIEAGAQLAGIVAQSDPAHPVHPRLKLTAVRAAKITGSAKPRETLRLTAELQARMGPLIQVRVQAWVREERILQAEVTLSG